MKIRKARGSIVIVALWALLFFSMLTITLAARVQSQVSFIKRFQTERQSNLEAYSGVSYALAVLRKISARKEAELQGAAVGTAAKEEIYFKGFRGDRFRVGREEPGAKTGDPEFVFGFQDEESKININQVPLEALKRLYQFGGDLSEDHAQALAQATMDWRARENEFLEFGHELKPGGAGFGSVEELLLVQGMNAQLWQKLKKILTVFGKGQVNMNTVSPETLKALGVNESLAARIVQVREAQLRILRPADASDAKIFNDLGDLTQKIGVSAGEIDELQNISSVWGFESGTVRFVSLSSGSPKLGRVECVASREGRILFFRN